MGFMCTEIGLVCVLNNDFYSSIFSEAGYIFTSTCAVAAAKTILDDKLINEYDFYYLSGFWKMGCIPCLYSFVWLLMCSLTHGSYPGSMLIMKNIEFCFFSFF